MGRSDAVKDPDSAQTKIESERRRMRSPSSPLVNDWGIRKHPIRLTWHDIPANKAAEPVETSDIDIEPEGPEGDDVAVNDTELGNKALAMYTNMGVNDLANEVSIILVGPLRI